MQLIKMDKGRTVTVDPDFSESSIFNDGEEKRVLLSGWNLNIQF